MKSLADRFRTWYEYERDCNAKSLEMLASVPEERRAAPEFQKAVDEMKAGNEAIDNMVDFLFKASRFIRR